MTQKTYKKYKSAMMFFFKDFYQLWTIGDVLFIIAFIASAYPSWNPEYLIMLLFIPFFHLLYLPVIILNIKAVKDLKHGNIEKKRVCAECISFNKRYNLTRGSGHTKYDLITRVQEKYVFCPKREPDPPLFLKNFDAEISYGKNSGILFSLQINGKEYL